MSDFKIVIFLGNNKKQTITKPTIVAVTISVTRIVRVSRRLPNTLSSQYIEMQEVVYRAIAWRKCARVTEYAAFRYPTGNL